MDSIVSCWHQGTGSAAPLADRVMLRPMQVTTAKVVGDFAGARTWEVVVVPTSF